MITHFSPLCSTVTLSFSIPTFVPQIPGNRSCNSFNFKRDSGG